MIYGYARVSTKGQEENNSLQQQENELRTAGAVEVIKEAFTGTKFHRPKLDSLLDQIQEGDVLIVTKLDRIARSAKDGITIIDFVMEKGASIQVLNMGTFDNSPMGKVVRTVMLGFAEFERDMIVQRTQEGKALARKNPDFVEGRPRKFTDFQIESALKLLDEGKPYKEVVKLTGISKSTLIRAKRQKSIE